MAHQHHDPERTPNQPADSPPMNRAQRRAQAFGQRPKAEPHGGYRQANVIKPRGTRSNRTAIPTGDSVKTRVFEKGGDGA
ncbi:hypothetical protein CH254_18065 [Rhodococcus sp. 06-412-2C]|uniref:hypothetical protein n=1 Tax=unclassified Rhodococcus (in: high G+C Gram-positive bacteria) TaxID=192944 RepID=UPI000BCE476E|nr:MULTISPECIES: hypothetical protein [unclassified Rhodococcus (in: high G+C Gram-positive bacteria)]OZC86447.1 hypothetical protein CH254_18065 [Rhodococcus sp. 06-412-2C]